MPNQLQVHSRPLRIAVVASQSVNAGGGNVYENAIAPRFREWSESRGVTSKLFARSSGGFLSNRDTKNSAMDSYSVSILEKIAIVAPQFSVSRILGLFGRSNSLLSQLRQFEPDIVYFVSPNPLAANLRTFPFILTHWDLGHREVPFLPELSEGMEWDKRELIAQKTYPRAVHTFTESVASAKLLAETYGVSTQRLSSLGMGLAAEPLANDPTPAVEGDYICYPAAKWPHKNHVTLFRAFAQARKVLPNLKLVLTGGDKGNEAFLHDLARSLKIDEAVLDLGLVDSQLLANAISHSRALVMPSVLGPTNIPPLEALKSGVPVIASSIHKFDETYCKAIASLDPFDVDSWAKEIIRICSETRPRENVMAVSDVDVEAQWDSVFEEFARYRELWS